MNRLTDAQGIADANGVSARLIQRLAQRGDIPSYRVGRLLRFDPDEVRDALREGH